MKKLLGGILVLSVALNIVLWTRLSSQSDQLISAQASANELDELRQQNQELQTKQTSASNSASADALELARLRNQVVQLRNQAGEATASGAQLQAQLSAATQNLARTESELAEVAKLSTEQLQQLKEEALSIRCVGNMKQIGLAARMWANDHNGVFPPDLISMTNELESPKVLFCPVDTAVTVVSEWSQLNPSSISYRLLNPNGDEKDPNKPLTICPIHGHMGLSDGSVQRQK